MALCAILLGEIWRDAGRWREMEGDGGRWREIEGGIALCAILLTLTLALPLSLALPLTAASPRARWR